MILSECSGARGRGQCRTSPTAVLVLRAAAGPHRSAGYRGEYVQGMGAPRTARGIMAWVGLVTGLVLLAGCAGPTVGPMGPSSQVPPASSSATTAGPGAGDWTMGGGWMAGGPDGYTYAPVSCRPPQDLPGAQVQVALGDTGMTSMMGGTSPQGARMMLRAWPTSVPAGQVSVVVANMGWRTHEVVILPLADGESAGQRPVGADDRIDETGSLGEVSTSCGAGAGEGITSGSAGWTTLTLPPGRYELVCNLPQHYAAGMYQELDVTS